MVIGRTKIAKFAPVSQRITQLGRVNYSVKVILPFSKSLFQKLNLEKSVIYRYLNECLCFWHIPKLNCIVLSIKTKKEVFIIEYALENSQPLAFSIFFH